jgi:large subunit ribosomal protein L25
MATVNLQVQPRDTSGKGAARKLRAAGRIPAVLYGAGLDEPRSFSIDTRELWLALRGSAGSRAVFKLQLEGEKGDPAVALLREVQRHPVTHDLVHVDLFAIDLTQPVEVNVPIQAQGTPLGVKMEGGVLEWARREVAIRVLPTAIPETYDLDISEMQIGHSFHISDLTADGYEILDDPALTICSVKSPRLIEEVVEEGEEIEGEEGAEAAGEGGESDKAAAETKSEDE